MYTEGHDREARRPSMSILSNVHMMSNLSRGGAAAIMEAAQDGNPAVIMKNSRPYRVIMTVADYERIADLEDRAKALPMVINQMVGNSPVGVHTARE